MDVTAIPVLPVRDLDATLAFYGALGFRLIFEQLEPDPYAIVELHGAEVHFYGTATPSPGAGICYLRVMDAGLVHRAWSAAAKLPATGTPSLGPLADRPSGMREFELVDPSGNRVRVGQMLE
jgi:catechol 2,3-dioxygenase-like lactoylglutathione lyase family enzyme